MIYKTTYITTYNQKYFYMINQQTSSKNNIDYYLVIDRLLSQHTHYSRKM